jgi:hypothetical protein
LRQDAGDFLATGSEQKQRPEQQIETHRAIRGLHLGHSRLAGAQAASQFLLRQAEFLALAANTGGRLLEWKEV